jgi:hypothetical protein
LACYEDSMFAEPNLHGCMNSFFIDVFLVQDEDNGPEVMAI